MRAGHALSDGGGVCVLGCAAVRRAARIAWPSGLSVHGLDLPSTATGMPADWR